MSEGSNVRGHLESWDGVRGFGFARVRRHRAGVFVHVSQLGNTREPRRGDIVEIENIEDTPRGPRAIRAWIVEPDNEER